MALLHVKNLSKQYEKDKQVLSEINMEVNEGEFVSIIGPSGAGKSTFLRCINRMVDSSEGEIYFDDEQCNVVIKKGSTKTSNKNWYDFSTL